MERQLTYYDGTATNAINCYKTINTYGDTCFYNSTISPSPATMVPQIFCKFRPHDMPAQSIIIKKNTCNPYKTMNQK
jgi:hypothetical protein